MIKTKTSYNSNRCLTVDELKLFAKGLTPEAEEIAMKKHIETCSLCADALEGFNYLKENDIQVKINKINRKIKRRSLFIHPEKGNFLVHKNFHSWVSSTGIIFTILIVLGTFVYIHYAWLKYSKIKAENFNVKNNTEIAIIDNKPDNSINNKRKQKLWDEKDKKTLLIEKIAEEIEPDLATLNNQPAIIPPKYSLGEEKLIVAFKQKLKSENIKLENNLVIQFTLKANGTIENIDINNDFSLQHKRKVTQILHQLNHWVPASKNDQRIDYQMQLIIPAL